MKIGLFKRTGAAFAALSLAIVISAPAIAQKPVSLSDPQVENIMRRSYQYAAVALVLALAAPVSEGFAGSTTFQADSKVIPNVEFAAVKKKAKHTRPSHPIAKPPGISKPPGARPPVVARPPAVRPPIARPPVVVVRPPRWRGAYWGAVVAGVTLGTIIVVAANAAPPPPSPDLCWTWTNAARTHGYWYYCSGP